jgi:glycine cleavage system protein P-like pyridoxal-binding family
LPSGEKLNTSARQFAKRPIDHGIHPPTLVGANCVYFPDDLKSAMLIEPTKTSSKAGLDYKIKISRRSTTRTPTNRHCRQAHQSVAEPTSASISKPERPVVWPRTRR